MNVRCWVLFLFGAAVLGAECAIPDNVTASAVQDNDTAVTIDAPVEDGMSVPEKTFQEAEKEISDFINSLLRQLLPKVVGGSGEAKLSLRCTAGLMKVFSNIRSLRGWAFKMLDSMGKPATGILKGTSYSLGNYDECLDLSITSKGQETTNSSEEMFRGKYCRIRIQFEKAVIDTAKAYHKGKVNKTDLRKLKEVIQSFPYIPGNLQYMNHFIGLCFPSSCTNDDLSALAKLLPFPGKASVDSCEVKSDIKQVDSIQLVIISIFLFLFTLIIVSTFVDWLFHSGKTNHFTYHDHDKRCVNVSIAFSLCNNTKRLMKNIEDDMDGLLAEQCVRGIIVASVAWIIMGNTYFTPFEAHYIQSSNLENLNSYWNKIYFPIIQGYPLAIDALFVCYGFIFTYSQWYSTSKSGNVNISLFALIVKYYIRLCIPLLLSLGMILLLPLMGSGPFWNDVMENSINKCKGTALAYIGMYGNYLSLEKQCFPHLWFVPCLAQLTLFGIIISKIASKNMKFGILLIVSACIGCNAAVGVLSYKNNLPPSYMPYFEENVSSKFWEISMAFPLSHFTPYAIGLLTGLLIAKQEHHRSRMCVGGIGWIACIGLLYGIFSVLYDYRFNNLGAYWSAVYASLHRTMFGICVAWILIASAFGVGGFVNKILSWRIFDPLSKLSYYAYIFHLIIIAFFVGTSREHFSYCHSELITKSTFYVASSYAIAYLFLMLLEMPLRSLQEALCPGKSRQIDVTHINNLKVPVGDVVIKDTLEGNCKLWSITKTVNEEWK